MTTNPVFSIFIIVTGITFSLVLVRDNDIVLRLLGMLLFGVIAFAFGWAARGSEDK